MSERFKSKFFNEFVLSTDLDIDKVLEKLYKEKILGGIRLGKFYSELSDSMLLSFTEMNSTFEIERYLDILKRL